MLDVTFDRLPVDEEVALLKGLFPNGVLVGLPAGATVGDAVGMLIVTSTDLQRF